MKYLQFYMKNISSNCCNLFNFKSYDSKCCWYD